MLFEGILIEGVMVESIKVESVIVESVIVENSLIDIMFEKGCEYAYSCSIHCPTSAADYS